MRSVRFVGVFVRAGFADGFDACFFVVLTKVFLLGPDFLSLFLQFDVLSQSSVASEVVFSRERK